MALKILQIKNKIDIAKRSLAELTEKDADFEKRYADIEESIGERKTEEERGLVDNAIDEYDSELEAHEEAKKSLAREIEGLEAELERMDKPLEENDIKPIERKDTKPMEIRESREYLHAWVESIKTGKMDEVRSLLTDNTSGGTIAVPTYVEGRVKTLWNENEFFSKVRKTFVKGNLKLMGETSSSPAVVHKEGTAAPTEENLVIEAITLVPETIKKWISISDEALSLTDEAFVDYIFDELTYRIIKKFEADAITNIASAAATGTPGTTLAAAILLAIGQLPDDARDLCVICSKDVWAAAKAEVLNAGYGYDPFAGLDVIKVSGNGICFVGDLGYGYHANFPNGQTVEVVADARPKEDMVDFVGKLLVGHGVVGPFIEVNVSAGE